MSFAIYINGRTIVARLCFVVQEIAVAAPRVVEPKIDGDPWLVHRGMVRDARVVGVSVINFAEMCSGIRLPRHGQGHDQQEERQFSGPRLRLPIGWRHAHLALERTIEIHPSGKPGLQGKGV